MRCTSMILNAKRQLVPSGIIIFFFNRDRAHVILDKKIVFPHEKESPWHMLFPSHKHSVRSARPCGANSYLDGVPALYSLDDVGWIRGALGRLLISEMDSIDAAVRTVDRVTRM